jgi:hypothetical protein
MKTPNGTITGQEFSDPGLQPPWHFPEQIIDHFGPDCHRVSGGVTRRFHSLISGDEPTIGNHDSGKIIPESTNFWDMGQNFLVNAFSFEPSLPQISLSLFL